MRGPLAVRILSRVRALPNSRFMEATAHRLAAAWRHLCDGLYPAVCSGCKAAPSDARYAVCADCWEAMPPVPTPFSDAVTPFFYQGSAAAVVQHLKYDKKTTLAAPMAARLTPHLSLIASEIDRVIAIPLHPSRLRVREFNPSLLLARHLTRALGFPLSIDDLIRTRPTPPQVGLSAEERQENVRGAFAVANPDAIRGKRLLLLDDVYTTGATLREGKRTLIEAGGATVTLAAFCRAHRGKVR